MAGANKTGYICALTGGDSITQAMNLDVTPFHLRGFYFTHSFRDVEDE
jgi:hypothetical protein